MSTTGTTPDVFEVALTLTQMQGRMDLFEHRLKEAAEKGDGYAQKPEVAQLQREMAQMKTEMDGVMPSVKEIIKAHNENRDTKLGAWRGTLGAIIGAGIALIGAALASYFGVAS